MFVNDPGNRASGVPPCGCPVEGHEPFCDVGRYEDEVRYRTELDDYRNALVEIAQGEVNGFELQQIAIRALAGDSRRE